MNGTDDLYRIRCHDCHPRGAAHRPLVIREGCRSCADETANAHRALGHRVELINPQRKAHA